MSLLKNIVGLGCCWLGVAASASAGVSTEPFAGASNFTTVVLGDLTVNADMHNHAGLYVGGDVEINASLGTNMDYVANDLGLYVSGHMDGGFDAFTSDYYIGGTPYSHPVQNPGSMLSSDPLNGVDVSAAMNAKSAEFEAMSETGGVTFSGDFNNMNVSLTSGALNVVNWDVASDGNLLSSNVQLNPTSSFTSDTFLVVNYYYSADFTVSAKTQNFAHFANVIWNFIGDGIVTFGPNMFRGTVLAPTSDIVWGGSEIHGQLVANNLTWVNGEAHPGNPWDPYEEEDIPAPGAVILFLAGVGFILSRRRKA